MSRKVRILSLDGGGIRGILPGYILADLEARLRVRTGDDRRLADFFELFAGTSTGGILACGYLAPDSHRRPRYTAQDMLDVYCRRGRDIFRESFRHRLKSLWGLIDTKYPATGLEEILADVFGDARLRDLLRPCLITTYDLERRQATLFNKTDAASEARNFLLREVARATSAAPPYFRPALLRWGTAPHAMIDGAVFANNPAMCAFSEARGMDFAALINDPTLPSRPVAGDMMILSIGTGETTIRAMGPHHTNRGILGWLVPLLEIMMSGVAETVDFELKQIFDTTPDAANYIRLEPPLGSASAAMDDTSDRNLRALTAAGRDFVTSNDATMNDIVDRLIAFGDPHE